MNSFKASYSLDSNFVNAFTASANALAFDITSTSPPAIMYSFRADSTFIYALVDLRTILPTINDVAPYLYGAFFTFKNTSMYAFIAFKYNIAFSVASIDIVSTTNFDVLSTS